jgi:acyl-CoA synthetase (AMP-forming)/AMP-acid ligase II
MSSFDLPVTFLPDLIAQHGRWNADKPAVVEGDRVLSWREFDAATNRFAHACASLGLSPGTRLAVLMANSLEMVEVLFGAGKAAVSVVPLNVTVSDAAVAAMIRDSDARAVIASGEHRARIDSLIAAGSLPDSLLRIGVGSTLPGWQSFAALRDSAPATRPAVGLRGETECNIIYSSGTTGLPKGIVHSHQCRMSWALDLAVALRYHSGARTLGALGLYSNISWVAMMSTIHVGGTFFVMSEFATASIFEHIERYHITHGAFVPVQLQRMLECTEAANRDMSTLETLMCCGSPLPEAVKRGARDRLDCELIELYGLTEGIITVLAPEDFDRKISSVGKPIPGQDVRIVGDDDREVPRGESGEITGFGRLVMSGYHRRADATREATWTDPEGRRWLRTGDIGRIDDDGFLYVVDRKKDMIISGGQNVYPADIEAVMRDHPHIGEVAVIGLKDDTWGETPVAVVVPRAGATADAAELVAWTNARVGKQQRIREVKFRESLPRNPNGKILKRELRVEYT